MHGRLRIPVPLFLVFAAAAAPILQTETVRNEKVVVTESRLKPGETESLRGGFASATVYFEDGSLEIAAGGGRPERVRVKRGEAVFRAPQDRIVRNSGSSEIHSVRVDFLRAGGAEMWGTAGLSPNYVLLFENQYARVYDIKIPAHTREPQHAHKDRVVVCLSGATLKHLMPDGHEEPSTLKTGESGWRRGGIHIGQNLGDTNLWVIAIEPK
jgi:hypothetical protein